MIKSIIITIILLAMTTCPIIAQWTTVNGLNVAVSGLAAIGNNVYAGTYSEGVLETTNDGLDWQVLNIPGTNISKLASSNSNIFALEQTQIIFSTDGGLTWTSRGNGGSTMAVSNDVVYVGKDAVGNYRPRYGNNSNDVKVFGVNRSTDFGNNWSVINYVEFVSAVGASSGNVIVSSFAGTQISFDYGTNWQTAGYGLPAPSEVNSFYFYQNNIFACFFSAYGIYLTTDNGSNWVPVNTGLTSLFVNCFYSYGNKVFAGTNSGVYETEDLGAHWVNISAGLPRGLITSITSNDHYLFVGTLRGLFRKPIDATTNLESVQNNIPDKFSLSQNYPNPFNPTTSIKYDVPKESMVKIVVYDAIGREVKTLVNEHQNAGSYKVEFDGSNLSSGLYYYKIQSGDFTQTKKMVLIK